MLMDNNATSNSFRNPYIDIVRGIAILLVVMGHCIQFGSGTETLESGQFFADPIFKFIYSFHMPLFMLISGYLCWGYVSRKSHKTYFLDKVKGILIPLIAWHTLFQVVAILSGTHISAYLFFWSYFHTLWFLRALLVCYTIILVIHKWGKDNTLLYLFLCLLLPFISNRIIPDVFAFTIPYFIMGYVYCKYKKMLPIVERLSKSLVFYICIIVMLFILLYYFEDNYYAYVTKTYLFNPDHTFLFMAFVNFYRNCTAIVGCIFTLLSINYLQNNVLAKDNCQTLVTLGKISLCIYIINNYLNELLLIHLPVHNINYAYTILETFFIVLIGYLFSNIIRQSKMLNTVFLGGR